MRRKADHPLHKVTLNLFEGDWSKLQSFYGTKLGASKVIREIVRAHLNRLEAQMIRPSIDIDLDLNEGIPDV